MLLLLKYQQSSKPLVKSAKRQLSLAEAARAASAMADFMPPKGTCFSRTLEGESSRLRSQLIAGGYIRRL